MTAPVPWLFAPLSWPDTEREVLVVLRQCRVRWGTADAAIAFAALLTQGYSWIFVREARQCAHD
jgi:hypothetical protein